MLAPSGPSSRLINIFNWIVLLFFYTSCKASSLITLFSVRLGRHMQRQIMKPWLVCFTAVYCFVFTNIDISEHADAQSMNIVTTCYTGFVEGMMLTVQSGTFVKHTLNYIDFITNICSIVSADAATAVVDVITTATVVSSIIRCTAWLIHTSSIGVNISEWCMNVVFQNDILKL